MSSSDYKIYAIKYAHHDRPARDNFLGGDPHDTNMPLDYFVWAIVGEKQTFILDSGFSEEMAKKRARTITNPIQEGLKTIDIDPNAVSDVIISHMHYDHAGNHHAFPNARYHLQDREMEFCTGRCMCHPPLSHSFEAEDVAEMVRRVFAGRVEFHDGSSDLAPGLSVHHVGGHTNGLQVVRVKTARGFVVLASDASHLYANIMDVRPFPIVYNVGDMLEGYKTIHKLADSRAHIIPGHDPDVLERYPAAASGLEGWVVRVDLPEQLK